VHSERRCTRLLRVAVPAALVLIAAWSALPGLTADIQFQCNILEVRDTQPGLRPSVGFSVTDPSSGERAY
jgi:hypothetical protein